MSLLFIVFLSLTPTLHAQETIEDSKANYILRVSDSIERKFDTKVIDLKRKGSLNFVKTENGMVCSFTDMEETVKCTDSQNKLIELDLKKNNLVEKYN